VSVAAVELGGDALRVAVAVRTVGGARIASTATVAPDDAAGLGAALAGARTVVATLPLQRVTHRILRLPFRRPRDLAATVPLELLAQLPAEPPDPAIGFVALGSDAAGTTILAAVARGADVDAAVAPLVAAGRAPAAVVLAPPAAWDLVADDGATAALVVADGTTSSVLVRRDGALGAARGLDASAATSAAFAGEAARAVAAAGGAGRAVLAGADADAAVAAALAAATGAPVARLADVAGVAGLAPGQVDAFVAVAATALRAARGRPLVTLRAAPEAGTSAVRRRVALAAVVLVAAVLDVGLWRHRLVRREAAYVDAIAATAAAALPGARVVAPRTQLEAAVDAAARADGTAPGAALELLREISRRAPADVPVDVDHLVVDRDAVRLEGRTDGFDGLEALRRALAASPLLADVQTSDARGAADGKHVLFVLQAARRRAGGTAS